MNLRYATAYDDRVYALHRLFSRSPDRPFELGTTVVPRRRMHRGRRAAGVYPDIGCLGTDLSHTLVVIRSNSGFVWLVMGEPGPASVYPSWT